MCFSATASFFVAGALAPVAMFTLAAARQRGREWLPLAAFPAAFAIQQALEGGVWRGLDNGDAGVVDVAARGFLFFSHFFWLAFTPFAVRCLETERWRRGVLAALAVMGGVFGLSMLGPVLVLGDWLEVAVVGRSIDYRTTLIFDGIVPRPVLQVGYGAIILGALALSTHRAVRYFGVMIAVSLGLTLVLYPVTYISVWCFFAAVLSAWLASMFAVERRLASRRV